MAGFQYRKRDADAWEKRANQQANEYHGIIANDYKTYTVRDGDNFIRILPPTWEGAEHYGLDVHAHFMIGPDKATVICLNKMKGERCPICEAKQKAERAGDEELSRELSASKRVVIWMIDRKDEAAGPMIWTMPWTLDRDFCKLSKDPRSGELYMVDHPDQGYDISFEKTGKGIGTKYVGVQLARKESSVDQDFISFIMNEPIPETLVWRTYEEVQKLFQGGDNPGAGAADKAQDKGGDAAGQASGEQQRWRPRGATTASDTREEPPPASEADYGRTEPEKEPERATTQAEPASGKSKADELRERFKRRN